MRSRILLGAAAVLLAASGLAAAHELEETSATLVVRDGRHVHLRLQVPFEDVLRRATMPQVAAQDFRRIAAAMLPADFERAYTGVESAMTGGTALVVNGRPVALTGWSGPSAAEVQEAIRTTLMASLVDPNAHAHAQRLTVTSDALAGEPVQTLRLHLPALFGPYLLTAYRPLETWVREGGASPEVRLPSGR